MDRFFSISESEYGAEFCNVPEVEKGGFAEMFNEGLKSQVTCRKLAVIHFFISSRQVESVERSVEGVGFVLM